jgi:hypothetical protein
MAAGEQLITNETVCSLYDNRATFLWLTILKASNVD